MTARDLRDSVFRQKLGDGYIADAFRLAHQADPQALLFYNDYGGEDLNAKSDRIYDLVRGLVQQGVPIDGVGLQMHISASNPPDAAAVASNMRRLVSLGLRVNISEMDVQVRDLPHDATRLDVQKSVYHSIVAACVAESRCEAVTFWGFTDAHSWLDSPVGGDAPLLFDALVCAEARVLRRPRRVLTPLISVALGPGQSEARAGRIGGDDNPLASRHLVRPHEHLAPVGRRWPGRPARSTANGGKVLMGPHEVPTGEWIVIATDPAGAGFGLTGPKGE